MLVVIDSVKRKVHEQINAFYTAKRVKKEIFKRIVDDRKRLAREAFMDATIKATWPGRLLLRLMTSDFVEYLPNVWPINNIISRNETVNVLKDDFKEPMKQWEANLLGFVCARSIAVRELTKRVWKAVGEWKLAPWIGEAETLRGAFTSTLSCRECARSEGRPRILVGMEEILFHRHDPECLSYDKYAALNLQSLMDARQGHGHGSLHGFAAAGERDALARVPARGAASLPGGNGSPPPALSAREDRPHGTREGTTCRRRTSRTTPT